MTKKRKNLAVNQRMVMNLKDRVKKIPTARVPQHLLMTYLVICMQDIEKVKHQVKELFLLAQRIKKKQIKGESNF